MSACLIALGSNQGDREALLKAAVAELERHPLVKILAVSRWRDYEPIGGPVGQRSYLNGALLAETSLGPHELLACLQKIETQLGRRREERWGPRTIDLDLLLYDDAAFDSPDLVLPHPRMALRRFVLEPAAEVAGAMLHPPTGWTIARLLEHLRISKPYVAITGPIAVGKTCLAQRLASSIAAKIILEQPDWARLADFYADPPGHALQIELGFLRHRAELLASEAALSEQSRWSVSDFWFDQSAAFASVWLPKEQQSDFFKEYERLRTQTPMPRLTVLLDAPSEELLARVRRRGRSSERPLTLDHLERIRQAVSEKALRPGNGPILRVEATDREAMFAEVMAAVRGME